MNQPQEELRSFFATSEATIATDISTAHDHCEAIAAELKTLTSVAMENRSADQTARIWHLLLLQAYALYTSPDVAIELRTFHACVAAGAVAGTAVTLMSTMEYFAILALLPSIRPRHGAAHGEYTSPEASGRGIHEAVFAYTLRRYHLDEVANLFENEPLRLDLYREIGARVLFGHFCDDEASKAIDETARRHFGENAFQKLLARVAELRGDS